MRSKKNVQKKSVAIVGEGETESFYFNGVRIQGCYPFKLKYVLPKHSDWKSVFEKGKELKREGYDYVFCLIDMDVIDNDEGIRQRYEVARKEKEMRGVEVIETSPCTEFWFLLHFLPNLVSKCYSSCDDLLSVLRKYLPNYEKTSRYLGGQLYRELHEKGNLSRAIEHARELDKRQTQGVQVAYSQIYKVFDRLEKLKKAIEL